MKAETIRGLESPELEKQMKDMEESMFRLRFQMSLGLADGVEEVPDSEKRSGADPDGSAREGEVSHAGKHKSAGESRDGQRAKAGSGKDRASGLDQDAEDDRRRSVPARGAPFVSPYCEEAEKVLCPR